MKILFVAFMLLINKLLVAQSLEQKINFQIDKIIATTTGKAKFIAASYGKGQIYIIRRTYDSVYVTSYIASAGDTVYDVNSVLIGDNSFFINTIDSLYDHAKELNEYRAYSKNIVTSRHFLLAFYKEKSLQVFYSYLATSEDLRKINRILERLDIYMITPNSGPSRGIRALTIENWGELLKYLKDFNH